MWSSRIRQLGRDEQIIIHQDLPPIRAKLVPYYTVRALNKAVQGSIDKLRAASVPLNTEALVDDAELNEDDMM